MSKIQTLRGMNDIHPKQVKEWSYVEEVIKSVVESYGYEEIRFPVVEKTELLPSVSAGPPEPTVTV